MFLSCFKLDYLPIRGRFEFRNGEHQWWSWGVLCCFRKLSSTISSGKNPLLPLQDSFSHPFSFIMWASSIMNFPSLYFWLDSKACSYFHPEVVNVIDFSVQVVQWTPDIAQKIKLNQETESSCWRDLVWSCSSRRRCLPQRRDPWAGLSPPRGRSRHWPRSWRDRPGLGCPEIRDIVSQEDWADSGLWAEQTGRETR